VSKNQPFRVRLGYAWTGLRFAFTAERSLRLQLLALLGVLIALLLLRPGPLWWALLLLASAAVLCAELFNTAIEHLVDHLHPEVHPRIRIVKDCAAAAVLLASIGAVLVGIAFVWHELSVWALLSRS